MNTEKIDNIIVAILEILSIGSFAFIIIGFVFGGLFGIFYLTTKHNVMYVLLFIPYLGTLLKLYLR